MLIGGCFIFSPLHVQVKRAVMFQPELNLYGRIGVGLGKMHKRIVLNVFEVSVAKCCKS